MDDFLLQQILEFANNFQPGKKQISFSLKNGLKVKVDREKGTINVWGVENKTNV